MNLANNYYENINIPLHEYTAWVVNDNIVIPSSLIHKPNTIAHS